MTVIDQRMHHKPNNNCYSEADAFCFIGAEGDKNILRQFLGNFGVEYRRMAEGRMTK
jgi:hypothetical protein